MIRTGNRGRFEAFWFHFKKHWYGSYLPFVSDNWPVKVELKQPRANGVLKKTDWARRHKSDEKDKEEYELFYENNKMAPVSYDKITREINSDEEVLKIYNPDRGVYIPYKEVFDPKEQELTVDMDDKNWYYWASSSLKTMSRYWEPKDDKSWWQTPAGIGVLMLIFGGFFFLLYGWGLESAISSHVDQLGQIASEFGKKAAGN